MGFRVFFGPYAGTKVPSPFTFTNRDETLLVLQSDDVLVVDSAVGVTEPEPEPRPLPEPRQSERLGDFRRRAGLPVGAALVFPLHFQWTGTTWEAPQPGTEAAEAVGARGGRIVAAPTLVDKSGPCCSTCWTPGECDEHGSCKCHEDCCAAIEANAPADDPRLPCPRCRSHRTFCSCPEKTS